mgnify:CR=1 FL=1
MSISDYQKYQLSKHAQSRVTKQKIEMINTQLVQYRNFIKRF